MANGLCADYAHFLFSSNKNEWVKTHETVNRARSKHSRPQDRPAGPSKVDRTTPTLRAHYAHTTRRIDDSFGHEGLEGLSEAQTDDSFAHESLEGLPSEETTTVSDTGAVTTSAPQRAVFDDPYG